MLTFVNISKSINCPAPQLAHLTGTMRKDRIQRENRVGIPLKCLPRYFFFLLKTKMEGQQSPMGHLTLDDELPVFIARVLHGVEGLLGDAIQVHIPPVLQHLERDVCTVDHCSRCLSYNSVHPLAHGLLG
jgi:hypothetical protein